MPSHYDMLRSDTLRMGRYTTEKVRPWMYCPLCENLAGINRDGTLRKHRMPPGSAGSAGLSWNYRMPAGPVCKMSNK